MKILRSKGISFTQRNREKAEMTRGLVTNADNLLTPADYVGVRAILPDRLADYVGEDYALVLRQTVSVLDKIVRKPNTLRAFEVTAYVDRTLLAEQLWRLLCERYRTPILALANGQAAFELFQDSWNWKIHPYLRKAPDPVNPIRDSNADFIREFGDPTKKRQDFNGRWHAAFWPASGRPDYREIARAIFDHLFDHELKISGKPRPSKAEPDKGLIKRRGLGIVKSANDPRAEKTKWKRPLWGPNDADLYFGEDVSGAIYNDVAASIAAIEPKFDGSPPARTNFASRFGEILHGHFSKARAAFSDDQESRDRFWSMHNAVRKFYQKLARSDRFRKAIASNSLDEIRRIVPANKDRLLSALGAKQRNATVSELIRIGKLIVHATDMPDYTRDVAATFDRRMDALVESAGQSEIKRNEAFTRAWRNSVALSLRTLKAWADPDDAAQFDKDVPKNDDLASTTVAQRAVSRIGDDHLKSHAQLVFGTRQVGELQRAALFCSGDLTTRKERLWAMLRLAGELRDRANHFSTKRRLIRLIEGGILKPTADLADHNFFERSGILAHPEALKTFDELLAFDRVLQSQAVADELNQIGVGKFVADDNRQILLAQVASFPQGQKFLVPKFRSVMSRVRQLAENDSVKVAALIEPFGNLRLDDLPTRGGSTAFCQIGILRLLYGSGFQHWLEKCRAETLRTCIKDVIASKERRAQQYQSDMGRVYGLADTLVSSLALDSLDDLDTLFRKLVAYSAAEERLGHRYRMDAQKQRKVSNWVEDFKRELFAHLFGSYLRASELDWVWNLTDRDGSVQDDRPVEPGEVVVERDANGRDIKPWHSQFYAWLYLLPNEYVSLLRHEFRKTAALEGKAGGTSESSSQLLSDLDQLMGLYLRVQSAGFAGKEHLQLGELGTLLYEDPTQFARVYSDEMEHHHVSFSGTRRGLRQIMRFGHYRVLQRIFEKHRITTDEVDAFTAIETDATKRLFEDKYEAHKAVIALCKEKKPDPARLSAAANNYRELATKTRLYDFSANAARLAEHARLHQLMIRIVGRLTDFTLMWERDRAYLFLGMLYRQVKTRGTDLTVEVSTRRSVDLGGKMEAVPRRIGITLPDDLKATLRTHFEASFPRRDERQRLEHALAWHDVDEGFISLWNDDHGFDLGGFGLLSCLLDPGNKELFERYFTGPFKENQKDVEANAHRPPDEQRSHWKLGKAQIRNDFAHYNIISTRVKRGRNDQLRPQKRNLINLNYAVNAVRSLMSYDRKLMNAVSKAVGDILLDEGLVVTWALERDRLTRALVLPNLETHLSMARGPEAGDIQFKLPQASVRFTSMVKALFDFDTGGYRIPIGVGAERKNKGELTYPPELSARYGRDLPSEIFVSYPAYVERRDTA
ncbi:type VI-A CRISPR-associated RNA-guided ribonuclease Cas13a [Bradyrhizobium sp. SZCCHNRI20481]|uniref:type VI-A CRISPR-associated RNA-guided ribonuclease Cas13a n=1 Tax=Bradyrhizobium sp. SZCCHNRI20481 TaxID=3057286 RepID=UPI002916772A|nr:type VI-A CRISPR-associated RNA-guided ribonuclease Cas13a [Bradyrhizobium sp. SZCCHNRI20481]